MPLSGQNVCDEVAFRIMNRLPANGTGAGSIINFTNDCLGLITSSGSWVWDQTSVLATAGASLLSTLSGFGNVDVGKKISIFDSITGAPIVRVTQDDYSASASGYIGVQSSTSYNTFRTLIDSFNSAGTAELFPASASANVDVYYHKLMTPLLYAGSPTVRWTVAEMDDLLKDWTTAKAMKWLELSGWDVTWADCLGRLGELRRMYTTEREDMGPEDEAKKAVIEKNAVGRV